MAVKEKQIEREPKRQRWAFIHPFQMRINRGIETYLSYLSSNLTQLDVEVDLLTWRGPLKDSRLANDSSVRLRLVPRFRYYQRFFAIPFYISYLLSTQYSHLFMHFAGYGEGQTLTVLDKLRSIPFSLVFHFPRSLVPHRYREYKRWNFDVRAQNLIAVSQYVADQVEEWSGRSCEVIGHGVDAEHFRPDPKRRQETREALDIPSKTHLLISVAALEERKGIQWVIKALPSILNVYPNTRYLILGEGAYREQLRDLIETMDLADRVYMPGSVDDVIPYLNAADLALFLAKGEALPLAPLEAASSALPIITSQKPPFDELIQPEWGLMVDEKNTEQVAHVVMQLLGNPEKRSQMGAIARAWVKRNHSWPEVAKKYKALVE